MSLIRPFRAIRPVPRNAASVSAVPYDVVNRAEASNLAQGNPLSFLHISRPEIDLPQTTDPYSPQVYEKARENFDKMSRDCPMIQDAEPSFYVYQLKRGDHLQTGVAATFSIDEYDGGLIKKHERTRKDKEDDRTRHHMAVGAQTGPVFLAFRGNEKMDQTLRKICAEKPEYDFTAPDGIGHKLWVVPETKTFVNLFSALPCLYIADGHHRAASASRVRAELKAKNGSHSGKENYNFVLAVAFPENQLKILAYHRVVKDLYGKTELEFISTLKASFRVSPNRNPDPPAGHFSMYLGKTWYELNPLEPPVRSDLIACLDVSVLQDKLLKPLLGIEDPRTDQRIDFIGGIRGTSELENRVNSGQAAVAFSMHPTTMEDLMSIADQGGIMPPKSTWFEPKLRDGLLSHGLL